MDQARPSPAGAKCRTTTCTTQVESPSRLYCQYHWAMLSITLKHKLVDCYDHTQPLQFQPQTFLQARVEADKFLNQTDSLLKTQIGQKKKTG